MEKRHASTLLLLLCASLGLFALLRSEQLLRLWRGYGEIAWASVPPASVGLDPKRLQALTRGLAEHRTRAFLVVRHDQIAYEWYSPDFGPELLHYTASLAKSVV